MSGKKYHHYSSVFVNRDGELANIYPGNFNLSKYKDLKNNTANTFQQFSDLHTIEEQREKLKSNGISVIEAIIDIIEKVSNYEFDLMKYVLPLLDGILTDDRKNGQIINQIIVNGNKSLVNSLFRILHDSQHGITVHEAAAKTLGHVLYGLSGKEYEEKKREHLKLVLNLKDNKMQGQQIKLGDLNFLITLANVLKDENIAALFLKQGGANILATLLESHLGDLQVSYYALLNIWLISYIEESQEYFADPTIGLIRLVTEVIQKLSREKLIRVAFSTFRNLCGMSQEIIEIMVEVQLIKIVDTTLKGNIKDAEILDDLNTVGEILEQNLKILSSFEKYQKEINSKHLMDSPVHSEKFWRENFKRFMEDDYRLVKMLIELLDSNNATNQSIACFDLGEFCRFDPHGRNILEANQGKSRIMSLAKSNNQSIRESALLALQKIMLHNWNIQVAK